MTDLSPLDNRGLPGAAEIDTDYEDHVDEAYGVAHEVEEDLEDDAGAADYKVPEENRDVWKNFGCETEAGRALRRLYGGTKQKDAASRVSYPRLISPARRWEPQVAKQKPCPQRAHVTVPRGRRPTFDRDDPRNWYIPAPGRKPAAEILAEMEAHKHVRPSMEAGRDQAVEKRNLQDKFRYAGGNAMPSGAMGHVPKGEVPDPKASRRQLPERWDHIDETGLTKEQRGIFADLTQAVQEKQARLAEIDAQDAAEANAKPNKSKTQRNREALQLENDIKRCVGDIDKLLQISEE
jgi:hypothetical protein